MNSSSNLSLDQAQSQYPETLDKLPASQRLIMKRLMKSREMPYQQLVDVMLNLPKKRRLSKSQVDGALYELVRAGYLSSMIEAGNIIYVLQVDSSGNPQPDGEEKIWNDFNFALDKLDDINSTD